jgi:prophage regulatory protein
MTRLTARQVADRLNIARSTLYRWMVEYDFPRPVKIGGRREWILDEIEVWFAKQVETRG